MRETFRQKNQIFGLDGFRDVESKNFNRKSTLCSKLCQPLVHSGAQYSQVIWIFDMFVYILF